MEAQSSYGQEVSGCHAGSVAAPKFFGLRSAMLCLDCEQVFDGRGMHQRCPVCGSGAVTSLTHWVPTMPATVPAIAG